MASNDPTVNGGWQPEGERPLPDASLDGDASLRRALEILGLFSSERRWLGLGEIAHELGVSPTDARAQVNAMRRLQLVREESLNRYGLGPGPHDLAMDAVRAAGVARRIRPHLVGLHARTRLPVALTLLGGVELLVSERAGSDGRPHVEMTIDLDRRAPAHATALGKVLLAYLPERHELRAVEALDLAPLTSHTIADAGRLLRHLHQVRNSGMALEDEEHMPHRRCLAVPVRVARRCVIAALGLRMTDSHAPLHELADRYRDELLDAAQQLSQALRYAQVELPEQ